MEEGLKVIRLREDNEMENLVGKMMNAKHEIYFYFFSWGFYFFSAGYFAFEKSYKVPMRSNMSTGLMQA